MERNAGESVFARPANWNTTIPALFAAGIAGVSVLYSLFVIPGRMPGFYASSLNEARESYSDAVDGGDIDQLRRAAGDLNVIYNRLVLLEAGDPNRYWQWAEFSREYADHLERELGHRKDDLPDEEFGELQTLVAVSREKAQDTFEYLSHTDSEFSELAYLNFIEDKVERGLADYQFPDLSDALPKLRELSASHESEIVQRSVPLYLQVGIETAWGEHSAGGISLQRLWLDETALQETLGQISDINAAPFTALHRSYLRLADCLRPGQVSIAEQKRTADSALQGTADGWKSRLAEVLDGIVDGEWNDVAFLLARKNSDNGEAVRLGTARWICRLAVSEKAKIDAEWRSNYASGLQIVLQIAPQIPELAELVWVMADQHASASVAEASESEETASQPGDLAGSGDMADGSQVVVPPEMVDAVIGGRAVAVRHMVLAFSSMLNGKMDVARSHLQLTQRSSGTLMQVSHIALGRLRSGAASDADVARLVQLMEAVVQLEPASGLNWFVLGVAQQRQGGLAAAETSLAKADELLPDTGAIKELLESVRSDRKRKERESQLRPVE